MDSVAMGPDGQANHLLGLMRSQRNSGSLKSYTEFLPGLFLNSDPALELRGKFKSPADQLLELTLKPHGNGNWCGLHLALGPMRLDNLGIFGFALRGHAREMTMLRACLRSGTDEGFVDCFFDKHVLLRAEEASHIDALSLNQNTDIPEHANWRELVIFLPTQACQLMLADLRVFAV